MCVCFVCVLCVFTLLLLPIDHTLREASAALLGKMMRDRLVGREVEIATAKFLPPKFQINMKESPPTAVAEFEGESSLDSVSGLLAD